MLMNSRMTIVFFLFALLVLIYPVNAYTYFIESSDSMQDTGLSIPSVMLPSSIAKGFKDEFASDGWTGIYNNGPDARESHWNIKTKGNQYVETANFAFFAGHGNADGFFFQAADPGGVKQLTYTNAAWGGQSTLKWVAIHACQVLNGASWPNWKPAFRGIHAIYGFDTDALSPSDHGTLFANMMQGKAAQNPGKPWTIWWSWIQSTKMTFKDGTKRGAILYDKPTAGDYLPGHGGSSSPTGTLDYFNFDCDPPGWQISKVGAVVTDPLIRRDGKYKKATYILNTKIISVPENIQVYRTSDPAINAKNVSMIASGLHIKGKIWENDINYGINADDNSFIFVMKKDGSHIFYANQDRYRPNGYDIPSNLPSDQKAIEIASKFLKSSGLMPNGSISIETRHSKIEGLSPSNERVVDWEDIHVNFYRKIGGYDVLLSAITVEIGAGEDILGIYSNWHEYTPVGTLSLKSPDIAYQEFRNHDLHFHSTEPEKIVVNRITLAYNSLPPAENERYLQPVYLFEGTVQSGNSTEDFSNVYISATEKILEEIPG